ncbi:MULTISPECIES: hypothetical protein [unclassified Moorena]|uniref:hypothetical protein n=1 Tax=unclassified Moorena TaxID=2683338 RepID=UPI001300ECDB|nr:MULTISPECIES: hypothetical protein [unclassified Moorena]
MVWCPNPAMAAMYTNTDSPAFQSSSTFAPDVEVLPPIYVTEESDEGVRRFQKVKEQTDAEVTINAESIDQALTHNMVSNKTSTNMVAFFTVGARDLTEYNYYELDMPPQLLDADGGRIRMIMQHETNTSDEVRVIDLTIGTEYTNDQFGTRGRFRGRYGWTRQQGGGDYSWILGDGIIQNIANPWDWAWILDWRWLEDGREIGGNKIRLYSHPHVTTRFIFYDN